MFTGIIETTGEVISFTPGEGAARLVVGAPGLAGQLRKGDSIGVSGVCLTALEMGGDGSAADWFATDLAEETIARTTLSRLQIGSRVNLELPTPAGAPLGGHVVQGHVDGVGTLVALDPVTAGAESDWALRVRLPESLTRYVVEKGSIAVEGISLTVAGIEGSEIWIAILPHTYTATNLHTLAPGMGVNIEVDVLAKYAESRALADSGRRELTVEYLLANGY
jgi:riboflavin synthase